MLAAMALTVVVRSGDVKSAPQITFDAPRIVIGRGDGCEVRLPDPSVSHRHASIRQRGTDYIVIDEGSSNGTFVGVVRLSPQAPRVLRSGDQIRVGRIWLEVRIEQALPTPNAQMATKELALSLVAAALSEQGEPAAACVTVKEGPDAGAQMIVADFERAHVVGRGSGADLSLNDADCSRRHVEIFRRGDQLWVRELGSKNGAALGDKPLQANKETAWPRGEFLTIGKNRLVYSDPVAEGMADLERSADEHLSDDESIDPPRVAQPDGDASEDASLEPSEPLGLHAVQSSQKSAPIEVVPTRSRGPSVQRSWGFTDVMIALVALAVLAASVVGLMWLFKTE
jgi:pSer/pThr/pTyr-binding forkhead associated (FHA) protein